MGETIQSSGVLMASRNRTRRLLLKIGIIVAVLICVGIGVPFALRKIQTDLILATTSSTLITTRSTRPTSTISLLSSTSRSITTITNEPISETTTLISSKTYYYIQSKMNSYVLDLYNGSTTNGTPVVMWPMQQSDGTTASTQLWRLVEDGTIENQAAEALLDVTGNTDVSGVILRPRDPSRNQTWSFKNLNIICNSNRKALDIMQSNDTAGATTIIFGLTNTINQRWTLVPQLN